MSKSLILTLGLILLVAAVGAAGFYSGTVYEQSSAVGGGSAFAAGLGGTVGNSGTGGRLVGQIKTIAGNSLTVSTPQNVTTVMLSAATVISTMASSSLADLQPGMTIQVRGTADASGALTASTIQITAARAPAAGAP